MKLSHPYFCVRNSRPDDYDFNVFSTCTKLPLNYASRLTETVGHARIGERDFPEERRERDKSLDNATCNER